MSESVRECAVCHTGSQLSACSGCKGVLYCGREHQIADRAAHMTACKRVKRSREETEREEMALRRMGDDDTWTSWGREGNPFEICVGRFWGFLETRDYMRARFGLIEALTALDTELAIKMALAHLMDMLRLCRSDNMGLRDLVPFHMLRLREHQACMDFLVWWAQDFSDYDFGDSSLPYLDIQGADMEGAVDWLCLEFSALGHAVAMTLLKVRYLSTIASVEDLARTVEGQVAMLVKSVAEHNRYYWPMLFSAQWDWTPSPEYHSAGSRNEAEVIFRYSKLAWKEDPEALQVVKRVLGEVSPALAD